MMKKTLRVWWNRDGIESKKEVKSEQEAIEWLGEQAEKDLHDENITWNAGGLEEQDEDGWSECYNEEGLNIMEIMEEEINGTKN
jgi:hypothetical protein